MRLMLFGCTPSMMASMIRGLRTKNAISVAQKNLLDFAFATLAFAAVGFAIAFGNSEWTLAPGDLPEFFLLQGLDSSTAIFFLFQVMFCGTAATIVSGAVAERMRLRAYITLSVLFAAIIYPLFARWAWGSALTPSTGSFLANIGFVDFAGSTVVHATGGWRSRRTRRLRSRLFFPKLSHAFPF